MIARGKKFVTRIRRASRSERPVAVPGMVTAEDLVGTQERSVHAARVSDGRRRSENLEG